jgi:hypothetical protein
MTKTMIKARDPFDASYLRALPTDILRHVITPYLIGSDAVNDFCNSYPAACGNGFWYIVYSTLISSTLPHIDRYDRRTWEQMDMKKEYQKAQRNIALSPRSIIMKGYDKCLSQLQGWYEFSDVDLIESLSSNNRVVMDVIYRAVSNDIPLFSDHTFDSISPTGFEYLSSVDQPLLAPKDMVALKALLDDDAVAFNSLADAHKYGDTDPMIISLDALNILLSRGFAAKIDDRDIKIREAYIYAIGIAFARLSRRIMTYALAKHDVNHVFDMINYKNYSPIAAMNLFRFAPIKPTMRLLRDSTPGMLVYRNCVSQFTVENVERFYIEVLLQIGHENLRSRSIVRGCEQLNTVLNLNDLTPVARNLAYHLLSLKPAIGDRVRLHDYLARHLKPRLANRVTTSPINYHLITPVAFQNEAFKVEIVTVGSRIHAYTVNITNLLPIPIVLYTIYRTIYSRETTKHNVEIAPGQSERIQVDVFDTLIDTVDHLPCIVYV